MVFAALLTLVGLLIRVRALTDTFTDTASVSATAAAVLTASDISVESGVLLLTDVRVFSLALAAYSPLFLLIDSAVRLLSYLTHMERSHTLRMR